MITQAQIDRFNELLGSSGKEAAEQFAAGVIKNMGLETPRERGECWDAFRCEIKNEKKASLKTVCAELLKRSLSDTERGFIAGLQSKRKLTERQESWLRAIAEKNGVAIKGYIDRKAGAGKPITQHCQHEDLGSLGYAHGSTVTCPHCGAQAEVW